MFQNYERAYKILDDMAMNSYMWPKERSMYKAKSPTIKIVNVDNEDD